jgi:hypothetical protein
VTRSDRDSRGGGRAAAFAALPRREYVGLNDLAIERRAANVFDAVGDGTVERASVCVPFGFGGLTLPDRGRPISCRLLIGEMMRLGCQFSFLRRSFHRDAQGRVLADVVANIRAGLASARERTPAAVAHDQADLTDTISHWRLPDAASR